MSKEGVKKTQGYREPRKMVQLERKRGRSLPEKWTNERFDALLGAGWKRVGNVGKAIEKVDAICPNNHPSPIRPCDLKSDKYGCKQCRNEAMITYTDEAIDSLLKEFKEGWERVGSTSDHKTKIFVKCEKGHKIHADKYGLKEYGCRKCYYESQKIWDNTLFDSLLKKHRKGWHRIGNVINGSQPVEVTCAKGHTTNLYPFDLKSNTNDCYQCANIKRRKYDNLHFDSILESNLPGWARNTDFNVSLCTDDVEVICPKGHPNTIKAYNVNRRNVCIECWRVERINADIEEDIRISRRMIPGYIEWRKGVYERDGFTCQCCGDGKGGNLVAHHLDGYHWCAEKRTDVDNGVTLCEECHKDFHSKNGVKYNTKEQYNKWIRTRELSEIGNRSNEIKSAKDGGNRQAI